MRVRVALAAGLLVALAGAASAAVLILSNGDRVTGKITLRGKSTVRLRTPYGMLTVPKKAIEAIEDDDGSREVLNPRPTPPPTPPPAPPELEVQVQGDAFWYAWDPRALPESTAVGLRVKLEDTVLATFSDPVLEPNEIRGAVVNAFALTPEAVVEPAPGVTAEAEAGGARLRLRLPPGTPDGRLRLSYVLMPAGSGAFAEVAAGTTRVHLAAGRQTLVRVRQARGAMEWSKRRIQNAETFGMHAEADEPSEAAPAH
jgi:hypothetical protein